MLTSCSDHQELSHVLNIWSDYLHCDNLTCGVLTSCRCYQNKKSTWSDRPVRIMRWLGIGGDKLDCSSSSILNSLTHFFSIKDFCEKWKYDELMCQGDNTAEGLSRSHWFGRYPPTCERYCSTQLDLEFHWAKRLSLWYKYIPLNCAFHTIKERLAGFLSSKVGANIFVPMRK